MSSNNWHLAEGDIVNCESVPGQTGSLSVSSYSPYSMMAIHYVPLRPPYDGNSLCPLRPPSPGQHPGSTRHRRGSSGP